MRFLCYGRTAKDNKIQFSVKNKKKCDALLYFSTICSVSLQEHFALFRHKKQSLRNCCRILNINLVIGIYKSNTSKLQMLPTPTRHLQIQYQQIADTSTFGIHPYMYLQIQIQQIADASNPGQASTNPIPASCRCFQPRPGICKFNTSKLQILPTPTRHLQLPKTTNQRCPPVNFLLKFAGGHLYCISISSNSYICLFLIHRGLSRPVSWHLFWVFPVFHRFPYAHLWKSLPTRQLLLLSVPDGFCPR